MQIKYTSLGLLIYAAMALHLAAAVILLLARGGRRRPMRWAGMVVYGAAAAVMVFAFVERWAEVDHVPLQNMFEVFLTLGMLMFPITLFCRYVLGVGGEALDPLIALVIIFPAAFVFSADPQKLPPALQSWLFIPHVATYMLAYVIMAKAAVPAFLVILGWPPSDEPGLVPWDMAAARTVSLGFPLLTLGLVLGAVWGKLAWGDYWNWDPKELWSLVSWLVYLGYYHVRYLYGRRYPRVSASLALAGFVAIVITLLWVNLGRIFSGGLHSYAS